MINFWVYIMIKNLKKMKIFIFFNLKKIKKMISIFVDELDTSYDNFIEKKINIKDTYSYKFLFLDSKSEIENKEEINGDIKGLLSFISRGFDLDVAVIENFYFNDIEIGKSLLKRFLLYIENENYASSCITIKNSFEKDNYAFLTILVKKGFKIRKTTRELDESTTIDLNYSFPNHINTIARAKKFKEIKNKIYDKELKKSADSNNSDNTDSNNSDNSDSSDSNNSDSSDSDL